MYRYFILLVLVVFTKGAFAQHQGDSTQYHIMVNPTGTLDKSMHYTSEVFSNSLRADATNKKIMLALTSNYIYGKSENFVINNDFSSVVDFNYYTKLPHVYFWSQATYNSLLSLRISDQLLASGGIAYKIIDKENALVNINEGVAYDMSRILQEDSTHTSFHTYRNALRLEFHFLIKQLVSLDGINFLENAYTHKSDYILKSNLTIGVRLRQWLSLTGNFSFNKETHTLSQNELLTYGLEFQKFF